MLMEWEDIGCCYNTSVGLKVVLQVNKTSVALQLTCLASHGLYYVLQARQHTSMFEKHPAQQMTSLGSAGQDSTTPMPQLQYNPGTCRGTRL